MGRVGPTRAAVLISFVNYHHTKLYPAAKHRDNRNGSRSWTQGGADRIAAELAVKEKKVSQVSQY